MLIERELTFKGAFISYERGGGGGGWVKIENFHFFFGSPPQISLFWGPPPPMAPSELNCNLTLSLFFKNAKTQLFCLIKCIIMLESLIDYM